MKEKLLCKFSENEFENKTIKNCHGEIFMKDISEIEFYIKNIMGPYYKVEIDICSDTIFIKKGYSLLGHIINLDTEGAEVEFIKATHVKHLNKTVEDYTCFCQEFSKINLFKCNEDVKLQGEKREVYWDLKITTLLNENMNVEGKNYLFTHWYKVIELISSFVEDDIPRKMGMI